MFVSYQNIKTWRIQMSYVISMPDASNEYQKYDSDDTKYELLAKTLSCRSLHIMIVKC